MIKVKDVLRKLIFSIAVMLVLCVLGYEVIAGVTSPSWLSLLLVVSSLATIACAGTFTQAGSLLTTLSVCLLFLYALPVVSLTTSGDSDVSFFLAIVTLVYIAIALCSSDHVILHNNLRRLQRGRRQGRLSKRYDIHFFMILAIVASFLAIFNTLIPSFAGIGFIICYSLMNAIYERRLQIVTTTRRAVYFMSAVLLAVVFVYVGWAWSGYGRIVIASLLLVPILIFASYYNLRLRIWHLIVASPVVLGLAQASRYGETPTIENLAGGSASHHLILSRNLMSSNGAQYLGGISEYASQLLLLFGNWFPRSIWESKPVGLGYSSVDTWFGRELMGDQYSVSIGMFGEQIFMWGKFWPLGLCFCLAILYIGRYATIALFPRDVMPKIIFDVSLLSYIWGGMALFGSRFWPLIIPYIIVNYVMNRRTDL